MNNQWSQLDGILGEFVGPSLQINNPPSRSVSGRRTSMVDFREAMPVTVHEVESLDFQLAQIRERIEVNAYNRFLSRGGIQGQDLDDWLIAESELLIKPQLNIAQNKDEIIGVARLSDGSCGTLELFVTPDEALLTSSDKDQRQVFAIFHFPRPIVLRSVDAEAEGDIFHFVANMVNTVETIPAAHAHVA
jgi:hypothetical protein